MPSKAKKQSKTPSRTPNSEKPPASPRTPLVSSLDSELSEEDLNCFLEEASHRYPSLIGKSAFIGRVSDADSESKGCKIWLSEASMVSASLAPGSIVSVSIAALDSKFSNSFPLSSISDDSADGSNKEAGNYFALAAVFPSTKIVKNGVKLSSQLSYTMGRPTSGRVVFVYSVKSRLVTGAINGREESLNNEVNLLLLRSCSKLYLELANVQNTFRSAYMGPKREFSNGKTRDHFKNAVLCSPKTPINQMQPNFPSASSLASQTDEESVLGHLKSASLGSLDVKEILGDESAKKLMQTSAASMLYSRSLLFGNIVSIPILSEIFFFYVKGADISRQDLTGELHHSAYSLALEAMHHQVDAFVVGRETEVCLYLSRDSTSENSQDGSSRTIQLSLDNLKSRIEHDIKKLGGLSKEYEVLKEIIISTSVKNNLSSFGLRATKGVLLYGPPGTGKTALARLCIHDAGFNLFTVNGPEVVSQYYGASEQALSEVFESAAKAAPSAVFIDELDAIAPARKDGGEELSQRMVATLLNLIDGISRNDGVLVIAATNRLDSIEPALRRPGRLDKELEIGVPSSKQRLEILHTLLSEMDHCLSDLHVQHLAMATHGFVGADLASLCNEAVLVCFRRYTESAGSSGGLRSHGIGGAKEDSIDHKDEAGSENDLTDTSEVTCVPFSSMVLPSVHLREPALETTDSFQDDIITNSEASSFVEENCLLKVNFEDFEKAKMKVRPSAMREVILEVPRVNWEDVGGQREIKTQLIEAVLWPQKHQDAFKRIGTRPPTGVLLFGPPGCSKTLMARAVASEAGLNFLAVKGPELFSKWVGESEKAVRSLFAKARANAPSIIFFDEIDSLAMIRGKENDGVSVSDRVMSQLLVELDGLHQRVDVTVIAATNRPDKIDSALLRPGRFDRLLYVGPPNKSDREDIFRIHLRKIPCSSNVSVKDLACLTEGCTGADISLICREAAIAALGESLDAKEVTMQNLKDAIRKVRPSEIQLYYDLSAKFQRLVQSTARGEKSENQQCSSETEQSSICRSLTNYVSWFFNGFKTTD